MYGSGLTHLVWIISTEGHEQTRGSAWTTGLVVLSRKWSQSHHYSYEKLEAWNYTHGYFSRTCDFLIGEERILAFCSRWHSRQPGTSYVGKKLNKVNLVYFRNLFFDPKDISSSQWATRSQITQKTEEKKKITWRVSPLKRNQTLLKCTGTFMNTLVFNYKWQLIENQENSSKYNTMFLYKWRPNTPMERCRKFPLRQLMNTSWQPARTARQAPQL